MQRGILAKLIEKGIEIYLRKECENISELNINIFATSLQIVKGQINNIIILAKKVEYKRLLFDEIELEANKVNINYQININQIKFNNDFKITFKISLSDYSLNQILLSKHWSWLGESIAKAMLNLSKFKEIKIENDQIYIRGEDKNNVIKEEKINVLSNNGKINLESKFCKGYTIPVEDKIYIKEIIAKDNLIVLKANSHIEF